MHSKQELRFTLRLCLSIFRHHQKIAEENLCKWKTRRVLEFILKRYKYRRYKQNVEFLVLCLNDVINCMFSSIFFHIEPKARVSIYPKIEFRFPFELKRIYEIEGEFSLQIDFRIHRMRGVYVRRHAAACDRPIYEWIPPRIDTRVCYWKAKTNQKSWCRDRVSIHRRKKNQICKLTLDLSCSKIHLSFCCCRRRRRCRYLWRKKFIINKIFVLVLHTKLHIHLNVHVDIYSWHSKRINQTTLSISN